MIYIDNAGFVTPYKWFGQMLFHVFQRGSFCV